MSKKDDYLYEKDGSYNPKMVKKILKAMEGPFLGPFTSDEYWEWLKKAEKKPEKKIKKKKPKNKRKK
jgi:hypothetical protein